MYVLVVGSTGVLGRQVTHQLLEAGHRVRAMTRDPQKAEDLKQLGAEVVQGDLIDAASLQRACQGVDAVLAAAHQLTGTGKYTSEAVDDVGYRALIDAANSAGVKHFVYVSAQRASARHPTDFYRTKAKIEDYLKSSGLSYTILRPAAFMEWHVHNLLGAPILQDAARYAVLALTDPRLKNRSLDIGGPENISKNDVVRLYEKHAGRKASVKHIPVGMMKVMGPLLRPIQPVLSRLMSFSVWTDTTDQRFDPRAVQEEFPIALTRVDDFVREKVTNPETTTPPN